MSVQRYRKKPVEVEAIRFEKPYSAVQDFCMGTLVLVRNGGTGNRVAWGYIDTLEGRMTAQLGDWIVRGVQGEFYPCKPDIFDATYEQVSP